MQRISAVRSVRVRFWKFRRNSGGAERVRKNSRDFIPFYTSSRFSRLVRHRFIKYDKWCNLSRWIMPTAAIRGETGWNESLTSLLSFTKMCPRVFDELRVFPLRSTSVQTYRWELLSVTRIYVRATLQPMLDTNMYLIIDERNINIAILHARQPASGMEEVLLFSGDTVDLPFLRGFRESLHSYVRRRVLRFAKYRKFAFASSRSLDFPAWGATSIPEYFENACQQNASNKGARWLTGVSTRKSFEGRSEGPWDWHFRGPTPTAKLGATETRWDSKWN